MSVYNTNKNIVLLKKIFLLRMKVDRIFLWKTSTSNLKLKFILYISLY